MKKDLQISLRSNSEEKADLKKTATDNGFGGVSAYLWWLHINFKKKGVNNGQEQA